MLRLRRIFLQDCRRKNVGVAGYGKAFFSGKNKDSCATNAVMDSSVELSVDISIFLSGRELIASDKDFDILLLDIEMPDLDGISVKDYFIT